MLNEWRRLYTRPGPQVVRLTFLQLNIGEVRELMAAKHCEAYVPMSQGGQRHSCCGSTECQNYRSIWQHQWNMIWGQREWKNMQWYLLSHLYIITNLCARWYTYMIHVHQMDPLFQEWLCDSSRLNRFEMKSHLKGFAAAGLAWLSPLTLRQKFMRWCVLYLDLSDSPARKAFLGQSMVAVSRELFQRCWSLILVSFASSGGCGTVFSELFQGAFCGSTLTGWDGELLHDIARSFLQPYWLHGYPWPLLCLFQPSWTFLQAIYPPSTNPNLPPFVQECFSWKSMQIYQVQPINWKLFRDVSMFFCVWLISHPHKSEK